MTVRKFVKAAAPYTAATFNETHKRMLGVNGVLSGGAVTTVGSVVTIQPLTFVQNGGVVDVDTALTATMPGYLAAPFFVGISTGSMVENLSEVLTPVFFKRPQDVTANTVLIAEFDGQEWRALPRISNLELIKASQDHLKYLNFPGIASGFDVTVSGANFAVAPGSAIMKDGTLIEKFASATLPLAVSPAGTYDRIDRIVLRKPQDTVARATSLQLLTGLAFSGSGSITKTAPVLLGDGVAQTTAPKILTNAAGTEVYLLYTENSALYFAKSTDLVSVTSTKLVTTGVSDYDTILNPDGSIDLVYVVNEVELHYMRVSTTGAVIYADTIVVTGTTNMATPRMVSVASGAGYFLHVVVTRQLSALHSDIGYVRLSAANTVETPYTTLVNLNDLIAYSWLEKDDDDSLLLLGYQNVSTQRVYLATYDAGTATYSAPPTMLGGVLELQDDTYNITESTQLAVTGADNVRVVRTADKNTYVFWLHFKGSGKYGVAVYHSSYLAKFGHKAIMQDYIAVGDDVDTFSLVVDNVGHAHLSLNDLNGLHYAQVTLETLAISVPVVSIATPATTIGTHIALTARGSLIHGYADSATVKGAFLSSTAALTDSMRDAYTLPSDILVASYRNSDGHLAVQGTFLEEDVTIRRLYEYNNLFAGTGSVTWSGAPNNKLTVNSAITMRFFNRTATYTIAANTPNGITVQNNQVCYVQLPDDDNSASLTMVVANFGSGVFDRHNRNIVPLFWAMSGVLYTRFAPFRLNSTGETIIVGDTLSQEMLNWLGTTTSTPDATNHGYSSTNYIAQTDSHNAAIGKLDANLNSTSTSVAAAANAVATGLATIPAGATNVTVTLSPARAQATYRLAVNLENTVDSAPMLQPLIIVAKAVGSFKVSWNVPTDSANYVLDWILRDN